MPMINKGSNHAINSHHLIARVKCYRSSIHFNNKS